MHVLTLTQYYLPEAGAAQARLGGYMGQLVEVGHQATVLTCFPNYPSGVVFPAYRGRLFHAENVGNVQVLRVFSIVSPNKSLVMRLVDYLSFALCASLAVLGLRFWRRYDVVVVESPPLFLGIAGVLAALVNGCPLVCHVSDLWVDAIVDFGILSAQHSLVRMLSHLERWVLSRSERLVTVTPGVQDRLLQKGVQCDKVRVITNGVDLDTYHPLPDREDVRQRLGFEGRFVVVYAGTHGYIHGLDVLIDTVLRLRNDKDILFLCIGDGADKPRVRRQAEALGLINVRFEDQMMPEELVQYLGAADVGVVTLRRLSLSQSALSVKMLSYMACACPVVLSGDGITRTVLEEAGGGIVVPPEDPESLAEAILHLRRNPALCFRYGEQGRRFVELRFDRTRLAQQFVQTLEEVSDKRSKTWGSKE